MLGFAWLTLRQAQEALKNGRLEEARRLLSQPNSAGHKASGELLQQIAQAFVDRGEHKLNHDDLTSAWTDLIQAEKIGDSNVSAVRLRQALVRRGLNEARAMLDAGEPARAVEMCVQLRHRSVQGTEFEMLDEAARGWVLAKELAARGEFVQAIEKVEHVCSLLTVSPTTLDRFHGELKLRCKTFSALIVQLHEAVEHGNWREVLQLSDKVLEAAPHHAEARKAKARAWKTVEPSTAPSPHPALVHDRVEQEAPPAQRFLLWIDGVGGYLVCLGTRVTIGQATPDACVDVPLFADVSRMHASLTRDSEGYLLEAMRSAQVNGQQAERALLKSGDRVTLGGGCQFQFWQPVPVSATARLDLIGGHRLPLAIDHVLLMADTLVIGPGPQAHVLLPDSTKTVVLFRHKDALGIRHTGAMTLDGQPIRERGVLGAASKVRGEDFALSIEPVGKQLAPAWK